MADTVLAQVEQKVQSALLNGKYDIAREMMEREGSRIRPVYRAIYAASLAFAVGDASLAWEAITEGLRLDGHNYELYMLLGEYYAPKNLRQAYLCYENALFYCNDEADSAQIRMVLEQFLEQGEHVPKTAIVILSYNLLDMTRDCIDSIRETTPESAREIIVVDNASVDGSAEWLKKQKDIKLLCNTEDKGFPAGCNQGVRLAEKDSDIFLLNNDTLMTDNALFWLRMGLYESGEVGSVGSVSNHVSNFQAVVEDGKSRREYLEYARQINIPVTKPYLNKLYLVGFAIILKRTVINQIGLLDERFSPGSWEDNDICLRINLAGYRNVLCKNSFIIHCGSKTFKRERSQYGDVSTVNKKKFFDKWSAIHLDPNNYMYIRTDLIPFIEEERNVSDNLAIMVVGTGCGAFLSYLQERFPNGQIYGMEPHMYMAQVADRIADTIYADLNKWSGDEFAETFDIIVLNDILERTRKPEYVLKELVKMIKADGKLVISFANSLHYSRISGREQNQYSFSRAQAEKILSSAKLTVNVWKYTMHVEEPDELDRKLDEIKNIYPEATKVDILAYQWINVVEKQRTDIRFDGRMAVCVPTCERPQIVEEVLEHSAETYHRYGLDIYYFDSSRNEDTKKLIESWQKRGYDNLYYIAVDPQMYVGRKLEHVLMMDGIQKEYDYMWYCKDRVWCLERTLRLMYRAMAEDPDILFLDEGHRDCMHEITVCKDANAFYHRCGDYATSIDTTIYNVNTILRNNFKLEEFHQRHGVYSDSFFHFLVLFEQLAKIENPIICLLAGQNVTIMNSYRYRENQRLQSLETWVNRWIQTNESLPDCYKNKDFVIKKGASFPWLMGNVNLLVEWHKKGVLNPKYYEEIKGKWERVSDIPLEILRRVAYGEYTERV